MRFVNPSEAKDLAPIIRCAQDEMDFLCIDWIILFRKSILAI